MLFPVGEGGLKGALARGLRLQAENIEKYVINWKFYRVGVIENRELFLEDFFPSLEVFFNISNIGVGKFFGKN